MYNLILDWLQIQDLHISDDIKFLVVAIASYYILSFLLDFFKMLYYTISKR